jgi:DNA primase
MARVSEEEIRRLKSEISLERLVEAKGVKLKRHGKDLLGLCPLHEDREPSLVITPEKNLWLCGAPHNQSYAEPIVMRS